MYVHMCYHVVSINRAESIRKKIESCNSGRYLRTHSRRTDRSIEITAQHNSATVVDASARTHTHIACMWTYVCGPSSCRPFLAVVCLFDLGRCDPRHFSVYNGGPSVTN
ncbi:hypothetical protein D1007_53211 [Hordeum vulgare]|nr:hypothetical protein D1007_53211 [Hordeum vulgare]